MMQMFALMALPPRLVGLLVIFSFCTNTNKVDKFNRFKVHYLIENTQNNHQNNQFWPLLSNNHSSFYHLLDLSDVVQVEGPCL